jgi:hypothetical protein
MSIILFSKRGSFEKGERKADSGSLLHAAGSDTGSANANVLAYAMDDCLHAPQIWIPPTPTQIIGVADDVAISRFLAANLTYHCHLCSDGENLKTPRSSYQRFATWKRLGRARQQNINPINERSGSGGEK